MSNISIWEFRLWKLIAQLIETTSFVEVLMVIIVVVCVASMLYILCMEDDNDI